jgi:hypothetical protein
MKSFALTAAVAAACICALPAGAARPAPIPAPDLVQPTELAVPADVVAAHPDGAPVAVAAVAMRASVGGASINAGEAVRCWRAYFTQDNSGPWGIEQEYINPGWCGNGSAMRSLDTGWHGESCSWWVGCAGEDGPATWYGCSYGCGSVGQQITGHFHVQVIWNLSVDNTIVYELYPNGNYWAYGYHN